MPSTQQPKATASATASLPVFGLIFAVLFVFKVAGLAGASWGLANLSWWWVFSPLLIAWGIFLFIVILIGLGFLVAYLVDMRNDKKRREQRRNRRP